MELISWQDDQLAVRYGGENVVLLPKEYTLLKYMYSWKNRTFSRENLLDAVWPLENPTDRTIDDHIYRLRKKLQKWSHLFTIDTVRGVGYRLTWKQHQPPPKLHALNENFSDHIRQMLSTYHGMGMGAALQTLAANQEILGFQLDPFYAMYIRFVAGNFAWFIEDTDSPMSEKLFYLFHLYHMTELDGRKTIHVFQEVGKRQAEMPEIFRDEIQINAVALYIQAGEEQLAREQAVRARKIVEQMDSESFTLFLLAEEAWMELLSDSVEIAESKLARASVILQKVPMQRELGSFKVLQGFCQYHRQETAQARRLVDEGVEVIRSTQFVPHLIYAVHNILLFFRRFPCDAKWESRYQKMWDDLSSQYQFEQLKKSIIHKLSVRF
ncbi:winged helix-turn-helix domain-containing protein [Brevibacillus parabrevis]|jgi:Response regulators consisting of a CheY-like receiver domain and a winged-helix DNA-binding domain|uniref:winged helix-turn-helix domain-containing protein n=1 Tax=Brevibacillus parabrevis TaxID=54914 RepID=UPI00248FD760|nr:winged helix-turn-helix domain-containing protein [Brevibacillus parabrevis]